MGGKPKQPTSANHIQEVKPKERRALLRVNPGSSEDMHVHGANSRMRRSHGSPVSLLSHLWERKRARNESYLHRAPQVHGLQPDSRSNGESDSWMCRHAFHPIMIDLKQQNCGSIYESTPWLKETNDTSLITLSKEELNKQWVHFVGEIWHIIT